MTEEAARAAAPAGMKHVGKVDCHISADLDLAIGTDLYIVAAPAEMTIEQAALAAAPAEPIPSSLPPGKFLTSPIHSDAWRQEALRLADEYACEASADEATAARAALEEWIKGNATAEPKPFQFCDCDKCEADATLPAIVREDEC
jgi:hypothetical protein